MLAGEFRYLEPDYEGSIYTEQLRNDKLTIPIAMPGMPPTSKTCCRG
jgi:hypothetical protein